MFTRQAAHFQNGLIGFNRYDFIKQVTMAFNYAGHKTIGDTLDQMLGNFAAQYGAGFAWLQCNNFALRFLKTWD